MSRRPKPHPCATPKCHLLAEPGDTYCVAHTPAPWSGRTRDHVKTLSGKAKRARDARVMRRHGYVCHICGQEILRGSPESSGGPFLGEIDHVVPLAEGGADDESNLRPAHVECHARKTQQEAARGRARARLNP